MSIETFIQIAENAFWKGEKEREMRRPIKVGEHFQSLSEDIKEKIRNMKSEDFKNVRPDAIDFMLHLPLFHQAIIKD